MTLPAAGDARIAEYASVADPDLARSLGLFVAEGRLVVRRLIDDRRYGIRSILLSQAAQQQLGSALERLDPRVPIYICPIESFREITGSTSIAAVSPSSSVHRNAMRWRCSTRHGSS